MLLDPLGQRRILKDMVVCQKNKEYAHGEEHDADSRSHNTHIVFRFIRVNKEYSIQNYTNHQKGRKSIESSYWDAECDTDEGGRELFLEDLEHVLDIFELRVYFGISLYRKIMNKNKDILTLDCHFVYENLTNLAAWCNPHNTRISRMPNVAALLKSFSAGDVPYCIPSSLSTEKSSICFMISRYCSNSSCRYPEELSLILLSLGSIDP